MAHDQDNDSQQLSGSLKAAVEQIVAEPIAAVDVERALLPVRRMSASNAARRTFWWRRTLVLAGLAACLLVSFVIFQSTGHSAWADVVEAVAGRPWLHGSGESTNGQKVEFWYSAQKRVMASKMGDQVLFSDARTGVMETYGNGGGQPPAIQRRAISAGNRQRMAEQGVLFQALLGGNVEKFLAGSGAELVEQRRRKVTVGGKQREEYRFVIADTTGSGIRTETTMLVDPKTKLPTRWDVISRGPAGEKHGISCELDYPDSGPASIYALGVPRSAPVVDNVPRGDLKRILDGLALGRTRFDNYRGIAVTGSRTPVPDGRGPAICYQVWRKGLKWRIELCQRKGRGLMPPDADPQTWWNEQVANSRVILKSLSTGTQYCRMEPVWAKPPQPDPNDPRYVKIDSFKKVVRSISEQSDPWRGYYVAEMAEFMGHPPLLGEGNAPYVMTVNPEPETGPAGCVLVESLRTDNTPGKMIGRRYWIDPARDYLVMRSESLRGNPNNPEVWQATEIVDMAQSPSGRWYPTQLRVIGGSVSLDTGEKSDYFNNYYLDFDADVPDELFQIPE